MNDKDLFGSAEEALQRGDYFGALQLFLKLREQRIDLLHDWDVGSGVERLRLRDINQDGTKEVGALTAAGRFAIFGLQQQSARAIGGLDNFRYKNFRFFVHQDREAVIVSREEAGSTILTAHAISRADGRGPSLSLTKIRDLSPRFDNPVLDIAYRPGRLYVTDSRQNIHQYNTLTLERHITFSECGLIQRLNTGGAPGAERESIMYNHLLGILQGGGLAVFEIRGGGLPKIKTVGQGTVYTDAFIGDPDNDGIDNIIAFTQDGRLDVYDWNSLKIRCTTTCPDELYAMYCHDIDGDGIPEILVGGRSNRIYVFAIGHDRELHIKWEYQTEHSVRDLWVGEVGGRDMRLVAGLANGKLQVFKIREARGINRGVAQTWDELSKSPARAELEQRLFESDRPEVVRFGLDELTTNTTCEEIIRILSAVEARNSYPANLHILSKLRTFLVKFSNDPDLIKFTVGFLKRLYERYPDLPTCEYICSALSEMQQGGAGSSEKLLQQSKYFDEELLRRKVFRPERAAYIRELAAKGKITEANDELKTLKLLGLDLLKSHRTSEAVTSIRSADDGALLVFTTRGGGLAVLDASLERQLFSVCFNEAEIHCCVTPDPSYAFVVSHGSTAELFDRDFQVRESSTYQHRVKCLDVCAFGGELYRAVGLNNGEVVVEGTGGVRATAQVTGLPVGLSLLAQGGTLDACVVTSDGKVWCVQDVVGMLRGQAQGRHYADAQAALTLGADFNALGWLAVESHDRGATFIAISPSAICAVRRVGGRWAASPPKEMGRSLISAATCPKPDGGPPEVILSTHHRSLLFTSPEGEVHKEVFLPDIPLALCAVRSGARGCEVVVGFAQGNINYYQRTSRSYLKELEEKCDKKREEKYSRAWDAHDLLEMIVLIALAGGEPLDLTGVHGKLDGRLRPLVPKEELTRAVKSLEQKNVIRGRVQEAGVDYSFLDEGYAGWVRSRQDHLRVMRVGREKLIKSIRLADFYRMDSELSGEDREWLLEFLLIDRRKWEKLLLLSEPLSRLGSATPEQRRQLRQTGVETLCNRVQAVFKKVVPTEPELYPYISAFEIQMPAVKFHGFDRIMVALLEGEEGAEMGGSLAWIKDCFNWNIILVLTGSRKELVKSYLREVSFGTAVLDYEDLKEVVLAESPRGRFLDLLVEQIDLVTLSPFRYGGPVREMFYGRETERQTIINGLQRPGARCHAVIGPRRIGKTSLLQRVLRAVQRWKGFKTAYLDCSHYRAGHEPEPAAGQEAGAVPLRGYMREWYNEILGKLGVEKECQTEGAFVKSIEDYCRDNHYFRDNRCNLVLFLDELDKLLELDQRNAEVFLSTLRKLISELGVKVLVAGYSVLYFQMHDKTSTSYNLFEAIELSALDDVAALALIEEPLNNLISIERKDAWSIAEKTACYPNFIQFCCSKLIEHPDVRKMRVITPHQIDEVLRSQALYDHMVGVHLQNLDKDRDREAQLLLYLMVAYYDEGLRKIITDRRAHAAASRSKYAQAREQFELRSTFTRYDLHKLLELHNAPTDQIETWMRKLVLASILKKEPNGTNYSFVLADLPHILRRNVEIELRAVDLLERIEEVFRTKNNGDQRLG